MKRKFLMFLILLPIICFSQNFSWQSLSKGIHCYGKAGNILITFAGWSVKQSWADNWARELFLNSREILDAECVYSVRGPEKADFSSKDINCDTLGSNLLQLQHVGNIIVIAHSSGSFVAHDFFQNLLKNDVIGLLKNKIYYFCLDGGIGENNTELTNDVVGYLKYIYAVYAFDSKTYSYSANKDDMQLLQKRFADKCKCIEVDAICSECEKNAKWCLHDALIAITPYNKKSFDLENDYNSLGSTNKVCIDYLNILRK